MDLGTISAKKSNWFPKLFWFKDVWLTPHNYNYNSWMARTTPTDTGSSFLGGHEKNPPSLYQVLNLWKEVFQTNFFLQWQHVRNLIFRLFSTFNIQINMTKTIIAEVTSPSIVWMKKENYGVQTQTIYLLFFFIKVRVSRHLLNLGDKSNHSWSHSSGNNLEDKKGMAVSMGSCGRSIQSEETHHLR